MTSPSTKASCTHYWKLETPQGPISIGRCKYCREQRGFSNSPDILLLDLYTYNIASKRARKRAGELSRERALANKGQSYQGSYDEYQETVSDHSTVDSLTHGAYPEALISLGST